MIKVVDYGVGNIQAFLNLLKRSDIIAERAKNKEDLNNATKIILPGVGHFDHAMEKLNTSGMREELDKKVLVEKIPTLGVCVGMQMMATSSEEGKLKGLDWIQGNVKSFKHLKELPLPHMGWNTIKPNYNSPLFCNGFQDSAQFYFLHSFYFDSDSKENVSATAFYGIEFEAAISKGHIHGIQCHPEKSHRWGAKLLKNFSLIEKC